MPTQVLAVDDEQDYRLLFALILKDAGYHVRLAGDGEEALAAVGRCPPDIILLDWLMPVVDGRAMVRNLRKMDRFKSIPVIMVSAKPGDDDKRQAFNFGVDDYIVKPLDAEELIGRIEAVLRRRGKTEPPAPRR